MSIASILLGVPGAVKRLRGHNAPKLPLHLPCPKAKYTNAALGLDSAAQYWRPAPVSDEIMHRALNNSSVVSLEVANLSGRGAFDGVWLMTRRFGSYIGTIDFEYDVEVLLDGVDVTPTAFAHQDSFLTQLWGVVASAAAGSVAITPDNGTVSWWAQWERASVPIPFKSSLVVNLIHRSSNSDLLQTHCWVNAWLTE